MTVCWQLGWWCSTTPFFTVFCGLRDGSNPPLAITWKPWKQRVFGLFCLQTYNNLFLSSSVGIFVMLNLQTLFKIVWGIFWGSVVQNIKIVYLGGSSMHFKKACHAALLKAWHSSIMYTLYFPWRDLSCAAFIICLTFSTPEFEAASISIGCPIPPFNLFA